MRFADRVISLTQTGGVHRRDSLVKKARGSAVAGDDEAEGDIKSSVWRGLSTREIFQEPLLGTLPEEPASAQAVHATAGIYRYFVKFSGRLRFCIFLFLCAVFVCCITFTRELPSPR